MKILQILILIFVFALVTNAQTINEAVLTGTVYDATGAIIPRAQVSAIDENGKKYETVADDESIYKLTLPVKSYNSTNSADFRIARYELIVDATNTGFEKFILKNFKLVSAYMGTMNLDIALDVNNQDNCGAGGCIPPTSVEIINQKLPEQILQARPLETLPKVQNKPKRKNKDK